MFSQIVQWVRRLFGKVVGDSVGREIRECENQEKEYEDTKSINFDSIFASSLSNKTVTDCDMTITDSNDGQSKRSEYIEKSMKPVWDDIKTVVAQALGKGGKFLIPYVVGSRVFVDVVDQSSVTVENANSAGEIISMSVVAETFETEKNKYTRLVHYEMEEDTITITTKAIDAWGKEVPLDVVDSWAGITEEISIGNVERMLVGFLKCPRDSRKARKVKGVPITYGCDDTKRQICECLADYESEFKLKRVFIGADETLFGKGNKLPANGVFKKFSVGGGLNNNSFWEVFDPAFRDSSYGNRCYMLFGLLEKEVGVSPGILTRPENKGTTAYEIKSENGDTYSMISDIRKNIERCLEDVAYAIDVYSEFFGLTPRGAAGDYKITFDWDTSLIESSAEKFAQLSELESRGLISGARLNSYVTGQSMEDAQAEIDAAAEEKAKTATELVPDMLEPDVG